MKTLWTDGYPADGRDTVVLISMPKYGGLSYRAPRFADGGDQEEARSVNKDEVGRQPRGVFLHGARRFASTFRWQHHYAQGRAVRASGGSTPSDGGVCLRDYDGISLPTSLRSTSQCVWSSTTASDNPVPWRPGSGGGGDVVSVSL